MGSARALRLAREINDLLKSALYHIAEGTIEEFVLFLGWLEVGVYHEFAVSGVIPYRDTATRQRICALAAATAYYHTSLYSAVGTATAQTTEEDTDNADSAKPEDPLRSTELSLLQLIWSERYPKAGMGLLNLWLSHLYLLRAQEDPRWFEDAEQAVIEASRRFEDEGVVDNAVASIFRARYFLMARPEYSTRRALYLLENALDVLVDSRLDEATTKPFITAVRLLLVIAYNRQAEEEKAMQVAAGEDPKCDLRIWLAVRWQQYKLGLGLLRPSPIDEAFALRQAPPYVTLLNA